MAGDPGKAMGAGWAPSHTVRAHHAQKISTLPLRAAPGLGLLGRQPKTWQAGLTAGLFSSIPVAVTLGSEGKQELGRDVQESFLFFLSVRPFCSLVCQQPLSPFNARRLIL